MAKVCYDCSTYCNQAKKTPTDIEGGGLMGESIGKEIKEKKKYGHFALNGRTN